MNYLGKFSKSSIPISGEDYNQLLAYTSNEVEIIIYYEKENPFNVKYIAILIASPNIYEVYEYDYYSLIDVQVKEYIKMIVEECLKQVNGHASLSLGESYM